LETADERTTGKIVIAIPVGDDFRIVDARYQEEIELETEASSVPSCSSKHYPENPKYHHPQ